MEKQKTKKSREEKDQSLREALNYYREMSMQHLREYDQMKSRFKALEKEHLKLQGEHNSLQSDVSKAKADMDSQVEALQSQNKQMDLELQTKDRLLKEKEEEVHALKESLHLQEEAQRSEKENHQKTVESLNQQLAETNEQWRGHWTLWQQEVLAEKNTILSALHHKDSECASIKASLAAAIDSLSRSHEDKGRQLLLQEIGSLKQTLKDQQSETSYLQQNLSREQKLLDATARRHEKTMRETRADWERRWAAREEKVAADVEALREENQKHLDLLKKERNRAATSGLCEKNKLVETSLDYLAQLTKVEMQLFRSEEDWRKKCGALQEQLEKEVRAKEDCAEQKEKLLRQSEEAEEKWMEKEKKDKLSIQLLVDKILQLHELASLSDGEKARRRKAERKALDQAAKRRKKEQKEEEEKEKRRRKQAEKEKTEMDK